MRAVFRRGVMLAVALLLAGPVLAQNDGQAVDPPGRVGRVARLTGTVSYHPASGAEWEPAALNHPLTTGAGLWTEPQAGADVEIGPSRVVLSGGSNLEFEALDDHALVMVLPQGSLYLRLRDVQPGETVQLRTPRGTVTIAQSGAYAVQAGDAAAPTLVTVMSGSAQVFGPGVSLLVPARTTATLTGEGTFQATLGSARPGPMAEQEFARERPLPQGPDAPPPILAGMTGGEDLLETGRWESVPEYGQVWYPPVAVGWVPYRHGRWSFVAPWGWTWIDEAPWGFAPFHYGRWRQFGPRWGWMPSVPGVRQYARPIYSPALVAFVGVGAGLAINRPVGWVPLGPREAYHPPYRASPGYVRNLNVMHAPNFSGGPPHGPDGFVNRRGATAMPAGAMERSQPVARMAQPMPQASLRGTEFAPPLPGRPMPQPGMQRPAAPGPTFRQMPQQAGMPGGGAQPRPPGAFPGNNRDMPGRPPQPMPQVQSPQPRGFAPPPMGQQPMNQPPMAAPQQRPMPQMQPGFARPAVPSPQIQPPPNFVRPSAPPPMAAPQQQPPRPMPQMQPPPSFARPSAPPPMAAPQQQPPRPMPQMQPPPSFARPSAPPPMAAPPPRPAPVFAPPPQMQQRPSPPPMAAPPPRPAPPPQQQQQRHCPPGRPGC